jgi:hypothetical protein
MAKKYGRQKEPRLGGTLRLKITPNNWRNKDRQVRRWCHDLERQLVRIARHRCDNRDQLLIVTDNTAAYCIQREDAIHVRCIEDNPAQDIRTKVNSYLGESDIVVEWD